jgi:hypothetical protein
MIPASYIEALFLEEIHRYGLVTLSGDMHHIDSKVVLLLNIRSIFDKQLNQINIASERCKMQGGKPVIIGLVVDPLVDLLFGDRVKSSLHEFSPDLL